MKRTILILLSIIFTANHVYANPIQSYTETIPITDSISLTKVSSFYADKNISYSYIKADLKDENTSFTLLKSNKGTDVLDTVPNLAKTEENVIAALNADFFSTHEGKGLALGIEIKDGILSESPINPNTMATVSYMNNEILMSYLDFHIMAVAPNYEYNEIRHLNKHTAYYGDILMYTSEFNGGMSPAPGNEVVEVVVDNGIVTEFRRNMPPVSIPENGCVLVVSEGANMFLANNFKVGDPIKFDYYITPDIKEAKAAFGGGAMLVTNGEVVKEFSHVVSGYNPRSAIGTDESGTVLYLVAVDGRQDKSKGMTMYELAELMKSLGCYNAVNLDGGGSTNMVASTVWNKEIHKVNSPTENRRVINAVGLTYEKEQGAPHGIMLEADKNEAFIGEDVKITTALHDENMRATDGVIELTSEHGEINGNVFTPNVQGKVIVKASYGNITKELEVYCVDKISGICVNDSIRLKEGETKKLELEVFDEKGHFVKVSDTKLFEITSDNPSVVSVSSGVLKANASGTATVMIKKDGAVSYVSCAVGEKTKELADDTGNAVTEPYEFKATEQNVYKEAGSVQNGDLYIGAVDTNTKTLFTNLMNIRTTNFINQKNGKIVGALGNAYSESEDENALYITVNTSKGGMRSSNSKQWTSLKNTLMSTQKKNVFILSDNSLFGGSDFEDKVVCDVLASSGKNVFVVTKGTANTYKNIKGVKYFTLGNADRTLDITHINNHKYLVFDFDKTEVNFEFKAQ